jgi:hypothetical protein
MRFPELLLVIILCLLVPAFGLPLSNAGSINDLPYPLVPMTYSHTIKGRNIELNGTIQVCFLYSIIHNFVLTKDKEVVRQLQGIDPDFTLNSTLSDQENFALEPRGKGNVKCCIPGHVDQSISGYNWSPCSVGGIASAIITLSELTGTCNVEPRSCSLLHCTYDAGLWLCNDNNYSISPLCSSLATYGNDLLADCVDKHDPSVCGQEFDSDGFNVIVHSVPCHPSIST